LPLACTSRRRIYFVYDRFPDRPAYIIEAKAKMDGSNGDAAAGGPNPAGGDGPGQGGVALLSDPVDVIIDKLLR